MTKIIFATTNENKLKEARTILGVELEGTSLDIPEIQSLDHEKVAEAKAFAYYEKLQKPIFVEDSSLSFSGLGGLPGTYINDFSKVLGNEGLVKLLENNPNREAIARVTVVLVDNQGKTHLFNGEVKGQIAQKPVGDQGFGWDPIFVPEGFTKTFAQMSETEKNACSMRKIALTKLAEFLKENPF